MKRARKDRGFAMVDTLVALTLLSIAGTVVVTAQSLSLKSAERAEQKLTALALAKSKLQTTQSSTTGEVEISSLTYRWAVQVDLPVVAPAGQKVQLVDKSITVEWGEESNEARTLTLKTKILR